MGIENVLDRLIEDIDRLSGVNLNQAICLTLGLEIDVYAGRINVIFRMPGNIVRTMRCPDWATDANAALELLSSLKEERQECAIGIKPIWYYGVKWGVSVCLGGCVNGDHHFMATAICKAWLKVAQSVSGEDRLYQFGEKVTSASKFENSIYMVGDEEEVARKFNGRTYLIANKSGIHIVARSAIV